MHDPSPSLPRGVIPAAVLAALMIVPLIAAIALDAGALRPPSPTTTSAPAQNRDAGASASKPTSKEFFDGKVRVQVYISRLEAIARKSPPPAVSSIKASSERPASDVKSDLHVRLENCSPAMVELDLVEVSSGADDVSAGMRQLKLAPGQTLQTGSALSPRFAALEAMPVKITMRLGDRLETQDLVPPVAPGIPADW